MNSTTEVRSIERREVHLPWSLWLRQIAALMRLEVGKSFTGKRALLIYLLALLPVLLVAALAIFPPPDDEFRDPSNLGLIFAVIYEALILRTVVFFGCAWIFMNLFRGEVVDRSLHYYFLAPVRREVLVVGKYLAGLVTSVVLFASTTVLSSVFLYVPRGGFGYFLAGLGFNHLISYLGMTALACLGYGAFFLFIGLFFRNPIIPALLIYGWEFINFLLPPLLKKISVIHYIHSLSPVPLSEGPLALIGEPTPAWISVPSLLGVTALVLILASLRIRRMEIRYGGD